MAQLYKVPDLVRIQTLGNILSNEAQWKYVTDPGLVDEIAGVLAYAKEQIKILEPARGTVCPAGYCPDGVGCSPCEPPPPPIPHSRPAPAGAARLQKGNGARRKKAPRRRSEDRAPARR